MLRELARRIDAFQERVGRVTSFITLAMVLGSSVEYSVAEVADRNAGIAAKLRKDRLVSIAPAKR